MVLQVHGDPGSINTHKVLAALDHMGTEYQHVHVDYLKGEHKTPEYLKINPNGTMPSATDNGLVITESNAILQYAADVSGEKGSVAYPKDPKQRAAVNNWLFWESCGWFKLNYVYLVENLLKTLQSLGPDPTTLAANEPEWLRLATILNDQLGKTKYVVGNDVTIADFSLMAPLHLHALQKLPLDKVPNVQRWIGDMEKVPAWQSTQETVNKAFGL